jgi:hypothetical protein
MLKEDVLRYFGGVAATARALNLAQPSITQWPEPLPVLRQLQVEALTGGALKAGPECAPFRVPADSVQDAA